MHRIENRSATGRATAFEVALVVMLLATALAASLPGDRLVTALNGLIANVGAS